MSEFDKVVHKRNGKGEIVSANHYILKVSGQERKFERPPKSGIYYDEAGKLLNPPNVDKTAEDLIAASIVAETTAPAASATKKEEPVQNQATVPKFK